MSYPGSGHPKISGAVREIFLGAVYPGAVYRGTGHGVD